MTGMKKFLISITAFACVNAMMWTSFIVGGGEIYTDSAGWICFAGFSLGGLIFAACMDVIK